MHKYLLLLAFCIPFAAFTQQRTKIFLKGSNSSETITEGKQTTIYVTKPVFQQDNAILTCDSAVFYADKNYFEAYRNVHINQADTINIYSQRLTYDGNTKMAHLSDNVRMLASESVLTTNILDYDMAAKIGTYITGGKIVNKDIKITSKNGYYFANTRDAYFRYNVIAITDQTTIKSDTLRYNTLSNWAYFYGPTNIQGKDDNLYTENGAYNTKNENAYFGRKNLYTQGSKSMTGDSLYYSGKIGYGKAVKNIVFKDTSDNTLLRGQLAEYYKADERVVVTQNAYFGMGTTDSVTVDNVKKPDSLWLAADTLEAMMVLQKTLKLIPKPVVVPTSQLSGAQEEGTAETTGVQQKQKEKEDALNAKRKSSGNLDNAIGALPGKAPQQEKKTEKPVEKPAPVKIPPKKDTSAVIDKQAAVKAIDTNLKDSVSNSPSDTLRTRTIKAYHNVKVYKANLQARADSLFYTNADSTLRWYKNPILWSEGSQQTGDTIYAQLKNRKLNTVQVIGNGFIVNVETDSARFNQIKGKTVLGIFNDGNLQRLVVDGNAESIYYEKDDKTNKYTDMNQTVSGRINAYFEDKALTRIDNVLHAEGARTPLDELTGEHNLTGFSWKPEERPKSKQDIIGAPYKKPVAAIEEKAKKTAPPAIKKKPKK